MAAADPSSDAQDGDDERGRRRDARDAAEGPARGAATGGIDLERLQLESDGGVRDPWDDADGSRPDEPDTASGEGRDGDAAAGSDKSDDADAGDAATVSDESDDVDADDAVAVSDETDDADAVDAADATAPPDAVRDGVASDPRAGGAVDDGASPIAGRERVATAPTDGAGHHAAAGGAPPRSGPDDARTVDTTAMSVAPVAAARTLTALDPGMRLADRLESDRVVTAPANRQARSAALVAMFVGLGLLVLAQRSAAGGGDADLLGIPAGWLGALLALAGAVAWGLLAFYGPQRVLELELAPDQQQQWEEVEAQARMTRSAMSIGTAAAAGGLVITAIALATAPDGLRLGAVGTGLVIAAAGGLLLGFAYARRGPLRLLYIQTLVLARLERTGVGRQVAADPKTGEVLMALDALLGELPESSVRRFLSKPEAEWYLDMVARIREGKHG